VGPEQSAARPLSTVALRARVAELERQLAARQDAEGALRESEKRYRHLFHDSHAVMLLIDSETAAIVDANPAACAYYGYPREALLAARITDLNALSGEEIFAEMARARDEQRNHFLFRHRLASGALREVEVFSGPIPIEGRILLCSIVHDVTARRHAEASLLERSRQIEAVRAGGVEITRELDLSALLDLIIRRAMALVGVRSGSVFLWDENDRRLVPKASCGLDAELPEVCARLGEGVVGAAAQARRGLIVNDYWTLASVLPLFRERSDIRAVMAEPLLYGDRLVGAIALRDKQGGEPFDDEDQRGLVLFATQAAIAIENARLFTELAHSYQALQESQAMLIRTEKLRALGQMSAGIAHDLNNTLAVILGQAELLRLQAADPAIREGLASLVTAATDGAAVVRRLHDFGRPRTSRPLGPVELAPIVRQALETTRPRWEGKPKEGGAPLRVRIELPRDLPPVLGHAPDIGEALVNLIRNAVDAMPDGGTLTLAARVSGRGEPDPPAHPLALAPPQPFVELTVADTGVGMSEEIRERVFDPFFTTKGVRGSGLGLSAAYSIMERHGGMISVASMPGKGTTCTLRFQAASRERREAGAGTPTAVVAGFPLRLLCIDDDPAVRRTLVSLLRAAGHAVVEAESGAAGLTHLAEAAVDLVITDLGMPEMNGWEVVRAVKARAPHLPVILLTGWGEQAADGQGPDEPVDRILGKPIRLEELLKAIGELVPSGNGQFPIGK
jgi:PAS domain S-box-containing protein